MTASTWRIGATDLRILRGMIIDRDDAWRADPEWSTVIDAEIRKGIENIEQLTLTKVYNYLGCSGLPGSYETYGFDERQMAKAWRRYLRRHEYAPMTT